MLQYPPGWPRCTVCGDYALDGHITCGRFYCNEGQERERQQDEYARREFLAEAARRQGSAASEQGSV